MQALLRYLRPYVVVILAAIVLLFIQANCDLALPDYLSRIVNVGIQQGGVEDQLPKAMRASTMARLSAFLEDSGRADVEAAYKLVSVGTTDAGKLVRHYPVLAREDIYVLKAISGPETEKLSSELGPALLASENSQAASSPADSTSQAQVAKLAQAKLQDLGPSMARQAVANAVKREYLGLGMDEAKLQRGYLFRVGGLMLALTLLSAFTTILVGLISARVAAGLSRDLRSGVFSKVEGFSQREFDRFSTASLITRTNNDIMQLQMVVMMTIRMVFYAPIIGIGGIVRALGKSSTMWWILALGIGAIIVLIASVFTVAVPRFKLMQKLVDRLNLVSRESLSGMMVIRAFNQQGREEERFDEANKNLTANMLFVNRVMVVMFPLMMFIMNAISLLIIWVGARQVAASTMQVGDMMAFMQYAMQIFFAFIMLSMMFIMLPRAAVSAERVAEVLNTPLSIKDAPRTRSFSPDFSPRVEFKDVSFRYPGAEEDVLHSLSFTAEPGETTAIIGATGSGKSTLVSLLPRLYDVTGGRVLVDGIDVRELAQKELRGKLGFVPQKASLFSGTIESNLRYADEAASEEVLQLASDIAQASEFISAMPEGMKAPISQGGVNVSGGQKQRLSIARALVKKPPILVFDDSFSALDFKTDSKLRRALKERAKGSTIIIVTQRVATVRSADRIIVLDEGRIVGSGRHEELMQSCQTYREIASSQFSEEELR